MSMNKFIILFLLLIPIAVHATPISPIIPSGTTLPATCRTGSLFIDTDADTDGALYQCVATDTWKIVSGATDTITGASAESGILNIYADAAEDDADKYRLVVNDSGNFDIESYYTGSWGDALTLTNAGNMALNGTLTFETSLNIAGVSLDETELDIIDGATLSTTQLNYLNAATGTTGTTSTNVVFSTSPTLATPVFSGAVTLGAGTETMDNATDDYIEFQGVAGGDDTDIRIDLDGTHPVIDSPTDSDVEVAENLIVTGSVTVGTSTVTLSSAAQVLTLAGTGGTYNENLTFDMDVENAVNVASGTGVTDISLTGLNVSTTGVIKGRASYGADIAGSVAHDTAATHGVFYHFTAAATVTLDAAADAGFGAQVCYRIRDAAEAAVIDIDDAEKINLRGTALAAGVAITATGAGESVCMVATTDTDGSGTDGWEAWGPTSAWASQ